MHFLPINKKQDIWRRRMAAEMMTFAASADEKVVVALAAQALGRFIADHADTPHSVDTLTQIASSNLTLASDCRVRQLRKRFEERA